MFKPRTIEEIEQRYAAALTALNSPVNDLSPGSVLSTLIRAFSTVQLETELRYQESTKTFNLSTASGDDLDQYAALYGLLRKEGRRASGFILTSLNQGSFILNPGFELVNLRTGEVYLVNTAGPVTISSVTETAVPIIAFNPGASGNLGSGSALVPLSPAPSDFRAFVGNERKADGTFCGALVDGQDLESDADLRNRVSASLNNRSSSTPEAVRQELLTLPLVRNAWARTLSPGVVEVLVRGEGTFNQSQLDLISARLNAILPVGIFAVLTPVRPLEIDVRMTVSPFPQTSLDELDRQLRQVTANYFITLGFGDPFLPESLQRLLSPLVRSLSIDGEIITPRQNQTLELGALNISYV